MARVTVLIYVNIWQFVCECWQYSCTAHCGTAIKLQCSLWHSNTAALLTAAQKYSCTAHCGTEIQLDCSLWHSNTAALLTVAQQYSCTAHCGTAIHLHCSLWHTKLWWLTSHQSGENDQHRRQEQQHGKTCFPLSTTCLNLNMFQTNTHFS
jgi:hypothetical protein